jgi:hypothetical protein
MAMTPIAHGIANQATTVMIRARAAITMMAHSVIQIANGTRRFRCMFGQIKRGEVLYHKENLRAPHVDPQRHVHRDRVGVVGHKGTSSATLTAQLRCMAAATLINRRMRTG